MTKPVLKDTETARKCPQEGCSGRLVIKQNRKTLTHFLGCENWPHCQHTEPLPEDVKMMAAGAQKLPGIVITLENIHEEKEFLTRTLEGLGFQIERGVAIYMPLPTLYETYRHQRTIRWDVYLRIRGGLFRVAGKLSVPERAPREIMTREEALSLRKIIIHRVLDEVDRPVII